MNRSRNVLKMSTVSHDTSRETVTQWSSFLHWSNSLEFCKTSLLRHSQVKVLDCRLRWKCNCVCVLNGLRN